MTARVGFATSLVTVLWLGLGSTGAPQAAAEETLTLATTTSTENTGLFAHIHPDFEQRTGIRVRVVAKGTGAALQLARDGNADIVLVHARDEEDKFIAEGFGILRREVMYNDFVLVGPRDDPARVASADEPAVAFQQIAATAAPFLSRGDRSGTHLREQELWRRSGVPLETEERTMIVDGAEQKFSAVRPVGAFYLSLGQGMGKTLLTATEKRGYTLCDRGTYTAFALSQPPKTDLVVLCAGHSSLHNPYGVIVVNPERHPHVNFAGAKQYSEWITSPHVQRMIGEFKVQGQVLFIPSAARTEPR